MDDASLMEGQGAERAGTKTAPIADKAEFYLFNGGHSAGLCIAGMPGAHIGQGVHSIHFLSSQRLLGRILYHKALAVGFCQTLGRKGIAVAVLQLKALGVAALVCFDLLKGRQDDGGQTFVQLLRTKHGAVNIGDMAHIHAGVQRIGHLNDGLFTHAVHQQVCLTVQQYGTLHSFGPVVIVTQSAQAGLDAANENGHILVGLPNQIAVYYGGVIRSLAHNAAGGEGIGFAAVLGDGIVIDHGVHITAADQKAQTGSAVNIDAFWVAPVGLGDNAHSIAGILQYPADDGVTKGRMIHIGVTDDIYKITLGPAPGDHIFFANGKKVHSLLLKSSCKHYKKTKGKKQGVELHFAEYGGIIKFNT